MWFLQLVVLVVLVGSAFLMGASVGEKQERKQQERIKWYQDRQRGDHG